MLSLQEQKNKNLKIALIMEAGGGGAGRHVTDLCTEFIRLGHEVHLIFSPLRNDAVFNDRIKAIEALRQYQVNIPRQVGINDIIAIRKIRAYLKSSGKFDIIHGHGAKGGVIARVAGLGLGSKCIYTPHGFATRNKEFGTLARNFYRLIEFCLSFITDRIITVSNDELLHACNYIGMNASKVVIIHNGIKKEEVPEKTSVRAEIGINPEDICLGFVGMFYYAKGADIFLKALAQVISSGRKVKPVIMGSGPLLSEIHQQAKQLGLFDKIIWLEGKDARQIMPAFDVMAITSRNESMPYVLLEALQSGIPVVATAVGGIKEIIKDGENGFLTSSGNVNEISLAIIMLIDSPDLRKSISMQAIQTGKAFTLDNMVSEIMNLYREVI